MPEGPEVYLIAKALNKAIKGDRIVDYKISYESSRYKNDKFLKPIKNSSISSISSKGKKIIFELEDEKYMISFLGLEGKWRVLQKPEKDIPKHLSIQLDLESGRILQFIDQRHFGHLEIYLDKKSFLSKLDDTGISWISSKIGPEEITKEKLFELISNKRIKNKSIMMFLVDQKYTSGIGNYIRSDALYLAKINPHKILSEITRKESDAVFKAVHEVIKKSLESNGHTLRSYSDLEGKSGGYIPLVYGKNGQKIKGHEIIREFDSQKRSIFWVPDVQV